MKRIRIIGVIAVLALVAAACGGGDETTPGGTPSPSEATGTGGLSDFGESTDADPALVEKALGPVEPSDEASWNIILASIARATRISIKPRSTRRWSVGASNSVTPGPVARR